MTRIVLSGAGGKMGKIIASCCKGSSLYSIVAGVDIHTETYGDFPVYADFNKVMEEADVLIDFSHPSVLSGALSFALKRKIPAVICTTGLSTEQIKQVEAAGKDIPIFFSANMSLGINLLMTLAKKATQVLGDSFDIEIIEKHHNQKIDAPSGTALMLADAISEERQGGSHYMYDRHSRRMKREPNEIGISSVRGGTIVGEHNILFAGRDETIELIHTATSKEVFAVGALRAGAFLVGKTPGMYTMADMMT